MVTTATTASTIIMMRRLRELVPDGTSSAPEGTMGSGVDCPDMLESAVGAGLGVASAAGLGVGSGDAMLGVGAGASVEAVGDCG